MKTLGYYNGKIDRLDRISVPMLDRACYFGDGVYDVTYARNRKIYALDEHVDRFFQSAAGISIEPSISKQDLKNLLNKLVCKLDSPNLWIYMQFSRSTDLRAHAFPSYPKTNLWIMMREGTIRDTYLPMRCITGEDTRFFHCNVKSLNLLPNVLATQAATAAGADECILHRGDVVTECAHSNLSIFKDGVLYTHPENERIYAGTGRNHLIAACKAFDIPVREEPYTLSDLMEAEEILITSASALCVPVTEIDGKTVGGKLPHIVRMLQDHLLRDYLMGTA